MGGGAEKYKDDQTPAGGRQLWRGRPLKGGREHWGEGADIHLQGQANFGWQTLAEGHTNFGGGGDKPLQGGGKSLQEGTQTLEDKPLQGGMQPLGR